MSDLVSPRRQTQLPQLGNATELEISLLFDYGAWKLAVGCQLSSPDGPFLDPQNTRILQIKRGYEQCDQHFAVTFDDDGKVKLLWKKEFDEAMASRNATNGPIVVINRLKACLFNPAEHAILEAELAEHLHPPKSGISRVMLVFAAHMHRIKHVALKRVVQSYQSDLVTEEQIRQMDVQAHFAVPEIASPATVLAVIKALELAGFKERKPIIVSESEAAGAWQVHISLSRHGYMEDLARNSQLREGDKMLVCDAGGFTYDHAVYRLKGDIGTDGANMAMEYTHHRGSVAYGSENLLTERLIEYAQRACAADNGRDLQQGLDRLHMSQAQFRHALSCEFNEYKKSCEARVRDATLTIHELGVPLGSNGAYRLFLTITKDLMYGWLEDAAKKIITYNRKVFANNPDIKVMTSCGGLYRSTPLVDLLKRQYMNARPAIAVIDSTKDCAGFVGNLSVVRGMGARHIPIQDSSAPLNFSIGLIQDEEWIKTIHKDIKQRDVNADSSDVVYYNAWNDRFAVDDRWVELMPVGAKPIPGEPLKTVWQEHIIEPKDPYITQQIFTADRNIPSQSAIYKDRTNLVLKDGIEPYMELNDRVDNIHLYEGIYPPNVTKRAEDLRYRVWVRVLILGDALNVQLVQHIAPPTFRGVSTGEEEFQPPSDETQLSQLAVTALHEEGYNPTIQRREAPLQVGGQAGAASATVSGGVSSILQALQQGAASAPSHSPSEPFDDHYESSEDDLPTLRPSRKRPRRQRDENQNWRGRERRSKRHSTQANN